MAQQRILALKGDFSARIRGSATPFKPLFNATAAEISMAIETTRQRSNGNTPGTIAEDEVDRTATFSVTLQSRHKENLEKFFYANSRTVAAAANVAFTLPAGEAGDIVDLGVNNVTETTFGTLVEGTDYRVLPRSGSIEYLGTIASTPGTFSHGEYAELGIFSAEQVELEILFTSEKSGQTYVLYRVKLSPAQAFSLVSDGTEYGSSQLQGSLLLDPNAPVDGNLGQYGRLRTID